MLQECCRNQRGRSPILSRELDRSDNLTSAVLLTFTSRYVSSNNDRSNFRHYNYRRVPYFGGSDDYRYTEVFYVNNYIHRAAAKSKMLQS